MSYLPHRVKYVALLSDPEKLVGHRDGMYIRLFAVVKISVRPPNSLEHFDAEAQTFYRAEETEARVAPILAEIAIHRIVLESFSFIQNEK